MTIRAAPVATALAIAAPHCVYADSAPGETIVVTATRTERVPDSGSIAKPNRSTDAEGFPW